MRKVWIEKFCFEFATAVNGIIHLLIGERRETRNVRKRNARQEIKKTAAMLVTRCFIVRGKFLTAVEKYPNS